MQTTGQTKLTPIYAQFVHADGSWYRLWITFREPKTERGHPWHLHATYDKSGTIAPVPGTRWYEQPYGMSNWSFDTPEAVLKSFRDRVWERLNRDYQLQESEIPPVLRVNIGLDLFPNPEAQ